MAGFVFENTTQDQAATFTYQTTPAAPGGTLRQDTLTFSQGVTASSVRAQEASSNGLTLAGITITSGGKSLTFPAQAISNASQNQNVTFSDSSALILGGSGATQMDTLTGSATADSIWGFSGTDSLTGGAGADFLNGGLGADTIDGGTGNDRIYGNDIQNSMPGGTPDDGDSILGGAGGDYIQGNQGNDIIDGGIDSDRIFGGSGNDTITDGEAGLTGTAINFGSDTINGNTGNDTITASSGDDFLRGGADDDSLLGGANNDVLMGDNGNDTLVGGAGLDILTGGPGTNSFTFGVTTAMTGTGATATTTTTSDALFTTQGGSFANITDQITDFQLNNDGFRITAGTGTGTGTMGSTGTGTTGSMYNQVIKDNGATFTNLEFARTYAQGLLNEPGVDSNHSVAAVQVGGDTYIFWDQDGNDVVESAVRLNGIQVTDVTTASLFTGI